MRRFENIISEPELINRYVLDESRFRGGQDALKNRRENT